MNFNVGDRVVVRGSPSSKYDGVTGTIVMFDGGYNYVDVDQEWRIQIAVDPSSTAPWSFHKDIWTLELEAPAGSEPYEEWFKE